MSILTMILGNSHAEVRGRKKSKTRLEEVLEKQKEVCSRMEKQCESFESSVKLNKIAQEEATQCLTEMVRIESGEHGAVLDGDKTKNASSKKTPETGMGLTGERPE